MRGRGEVFDIGLACSEDKRDLFSVLAKGFNEAGYRLEDGRLLRLHVHFYNSEMVIRAALSRDFPLICPESTLDLYDLQNEWERHHPDMALAITESCTFAMTPIVFLIRAEMASWLVRRERRIGWRNLLELAESSDFRVMRAHGRTGHGKLVTVAQFIAGMEREREHLEAYDDRVISFVRSLETATREYGLSDQDVIARALGEGEWLADLIVAQERNILSMLSEWPHLKAVLVYPEEGTVWADHPLALMESWAEPEPNYRVAFERLRQHVLSADTDRAIIRAGFHSARSEDLGSVQEVQRFRQAQPPFIQHLNLVTYGAPPMVLPGIKVAGAIGEQWGDVEKPPDVCLVIDVSGSMDSSDKLPKVKAGVLEFLDRFTSPGTMVAAIPFNSSARIEISLVPLRTNRRDIERAVARLSAGGQTALFDAVLLAIDELERRGDSSHIQAVIALTDGQENSSIAHLSTVLQKLQARGDLVFYGIAYGRNADRQALEAMALATKGLVVDSSPSGIQQLFQEMARRV